jgi:hypothetical protein
MRNFHSRNRLTDREEAADRIEKLEAGEIEFDRVIGNYASENARFRDRIEKLEAALREVLNLGNWGTNILARTVILEALEAKD